MKSIYNLPNLDSQIIVEQCDLLEQEGLKVIHCPQSFAVGNDVINPHSVIGQFMKNCRMNNVDVLSQIERWIQTNHLSLKTEPGDLCPIDANDEVYLLATFCKSENKFTSDSLSVADYFDYWNGIWCNMMNLAVDRSVLNVGVPGDKLVSVGSAFFNLEQKIGVIVSTYLKHIQNSTHCKILKICITSSKLTESELSGLTNYVFPFLYQMSLLPIRIAPDVAVSRLEQVSNDNKLAFGEVDIETLFFDDLSEMVINASKMNSHSYEQFEGSKKVTVDIDVDIVSFKVFVSNVKSDSKLMNFLCKPKGVRYDRNRIFQIIGVLHESSNIFGDLNRRSIIKLCIGESENVSERWSFLGENLDNIINYVGQKLTDLKRNNSILYTQIISLIPKECAR